VEMLFYVYILQCNHGFLYTGYTSNLQERLSEHFAGRGCRFTISNKPLKLIYFEVHSTQKSAMNRELAIKKMRRKEKLKLVSNKALI
jgi:putative endonuclease